MEWVEEMKMAIETIHITNERLETLHLNGDASIDFFNALFRPTGYVEDHVDDGITIREVDDGYIVTIDDLNLLLAE